MSRYTVLVHDPIVLCVVLLVGWFTLAMQGGIFQYAVHVLRLRGQNALAGSMHRMLWLTRMFLTMVTVIYVWKAFCWLYPPIRSLLPASSVPPTLFEIAWGVLLAAAIVHIVLIVPMGKLIPRPRGNLFGTLRVALWYDGFPPMMERWPGVIKLILVTIMLLSIVPFSIYLAYASTVGFARLHGYTVPNRTRMP